MDVLHGLVPPAGEGMVIEVHLDMMEAPDAFLRWLHTLGFADDPFLDFYPKEYLYHYTGRTRAVQSEVHAVLPPVHDLVARVIAEARRLGVRLYAESELVREIRHFEDNSGSRSLAALDGVAFEASGGAVKADVHVEFRGGTVPEAVDALLRANKFYWVRTPASELFPSEEIATLQTATFHGAQQVYDRLVARPLPGCTGIHLEQKLGMIPSHPELPLPEVLEVIVGSPPHPLASTPHGEV